MTLVDDMKQRESNLLATLEQLITRESPSTDKAAVDDLVQYITGRAEALGGEVEILPQSEWGNLAVVSWPASEGKNGQTLVMTHVDTVWPIGTIDRLPFDVSDGVGRGPGIFDMKASVAMMLEAITVIREQNLGHRHIKWLINTEEEMGSPVSRPVIEALATESDLVLCLEPPVSPTMALKTARKGVGMFSMSIEGKASHAGADPTKGVNAVQELANQIQFLHGLTDHDLGTTVNVGVVSGGTRRNVIPAYAEAEIDLRVVTMHEAERAVEAIMNTQAQLEGAKVTMTGSLNRPPMERTQAIADAFQKAKTIGSDMGLELEEASTGGASDGNFTAAAGTTTIDGLGCPGDGGHAEHEHILIEGMIERAALLTGLLTRL